MKDYRIFKKIITDKIIDFMPDTFSDYTAVIYTMGKVNGNLDGVALISPDKEKRQISPILYLNDIYKEYQQGKNMEEILELISYQLAAGFRSMPETLREVSFDKDSGRIIAQVINTAQNREMLKDYPNREFHDLSIVYRYVTNIGENGMESAMISNILAEMWEMDEPELFHAAIENTLRLCPPVIKTMEDTIRESYERYGYPEETVSMIMAEITADIPDDQKMYVISNDMITFGAAAMLYDDVLFELAQEVDSNLYILPSSVHEIIAVKTNISELTELSKMVTEINMGQVEPEERLSNEVYHYDKDRRELTVATDTLDKSLDTPVADLSPSGERKPPNRYSR